MPMAGEISTRLAGAGKALPSNASRAKFIARGAPVEYPTMWIGFSPTLDARYAMPSRTAAAMSCHLMLVSPEGAVPWPGNRRPMTQ